MQRSLGVPQTLDRGDPTTLEVRRTAPRPVAAAPLARSGGSSAPHRSGGYRSGGRRDDASRPGRKPGAPGAADTRNRNRNRNRAGRRG
ncbi:MAG: hypothetical protein ACRD0H_02075 [Actinomycetes bacterium]